MSDSDSADEPSPSALLADLRAHCDAHAAAAAAAASSAAASSSAVPAIPSQLPGSEWWEEMQERVAAVYRCNLQPAGRAELATLEDSWIALLPHLFALLPLGADVSSNGASGAARALALARVFTVLRNLCTTPAFQRRLRLEVQALLSAGSPALQHCVSVVRAMERSLAHDTAVKETSLLLKSLLQLFANMLTPSVDVCVLNAESWAWVHSALCPAILGPVLRLHRQLPELCSIATCIVHHALLSTASSPTLGADVAPLTRAAVAEFFAAECEGAKLIVLLLEVMVHTVEAQLQVQDAAEGAPADTASVWEWIPSAREPAWLVHIVGLACRSSKTFLAELQLLLSAQHWLLLLRLIELWADGAQHQDTLTGVAQLPQSQQSLDFTADAITANMLALVQWLEAQPKQSIPSAPAAASAASAAFTSSPPVDCASNAILRILGDVLLVETWTTGSAVSDVLRSALLSQGLGNMLLSMLATADAMDGGTMFSSLYNKVGAPAAGHTRHTKPSDDPQAYVNQFASAGSSSSAAASASASANDGSAASEYSPASRSDADPSAPRATPYLFKSHLIRLLATLAHESRPWQDALGPRAVYALMNHSVLDDHNPLMREHAVLALRNLLQGHEENQRAVSDLRTEGIANQEQLRQSGIQAELDETTGKVRVSSQPPGQA